MEWTRSFEDGHTKENYMLDNWGTITTSEVKAWVTQLKLNNCSYDLKNL